MGDWEPASFRWTQLLRWHSGTLSANRHDLFRDLDHLVRFDNHENDQPHKMMRGMYHICPLDHFSDQ